MIRLFFLALLMATVPVSGYAMAPEPASTDQPAPEKQICKTQVVTGSIMSRRICHTKAEWNAIEAQAKADLDRTRDMERSRSMVGGNR